MRGYRNIDQLCRTDLCRCRPTERTGDLALISSWPAEILIEFAWCDRPVNNTTRQCDTEEC